MKKESKKMCLKFKNFFSFKRDGEHIFFYKTKFVFWFIMFFLLCLIIISFLAAQAFDSSLKEINMFFIKINVSNFTKNNSASFVLYFTGYLLSFIFVFSIIIWLLKLFWILHVKTVNYQEKAHPIDKIQGKSYFDSLKKEKDKNISESNESDDNNYFSNSFRSY